MRQNVSGVALKIQHQVFLPSSLYGRQWCQSFFSDVFAARVILFWCSNFDKNIFQEIKSGLETIWFHCFPWQSSACSFPQMYTLFGGGAVLKIFFVFLCVVFLFPHFFLEVNFMWCILLAFFMSSNSLSLFSWCFFAFSAFHVCQFGVFVNDFHDFVNSHSCAGL